MFPPSNLTSETRSIIRLVDNEPGDDLDELDDKEEEEDGEDDIHGFLDDSEDAGVTRRIFVNGIDPESTV